MQNERRQDVCRACLGRRADERLRESDHQLEQLRVLLDSLTSLADEAEGDREKWRDVWFEIKSIGRAFKESRFPTVKEIAWSPLDGSICRVRLDSLTLRDCAGAVLPVDSCVLRANADVQPGGIYEFETLEPRIFLPVGGPVGVLILLAQQPIPHGGILRRQVPRRFQVP